jgi:hypothetical protein
VHLEAVALSEQRGALGMRWSGRRHPDSFGRVCSAAFEERIVGRTVGIFCHQLGDATGEGFGQCIDLGLSRRCVGFDGGDRSLASKPSTMSCRPVRVLPATSAEQHFRGDESNAKLAEPASSTSSAPTLHRESRRYLSPTPFRVAPIFDETVLRYSGEDNRWQRTREAENEVVAG